MWSFESLFSNEFKLQFGFIFNNKIFRIRDKLLISVGYLRRQEKIDSF